MLRLRSVTVLFCLFTLTLASKGSIVRASAPTKVAGPAIGRVEAPFVNGEVLVQFTPGARGLERSSARAQVNATRVRTFRSGAEHWKLGQGFDVLQAVAVLERNPNVKYAEPNFVINADVVPNDPRLDELWGMLNTGQTGGTADADIDADMAWGVSTGSPNVIVGVIDTGVDYNHPELAANIWTNPGEIPGNGIDDDNNGYVDDVHGYDFYNNDGDPLDDHGHGTHVSGTIGAIGDNGIGVAGVNWHVKIMGLKFLSASGSGSTAGAVEAVDYSVMMGVDLTSNSWGGGGYSQTLYDAIQAAGAQEMAFVAAAGNSNANTDVSPHYPSAYDLSNIISVAATDHNDAKASFSSYGATTVDLGAPGVSILSTLPGNSYGLLSGTSMATPHVSGVVALIRAVSPTISVSNLKTVLLAATDPIPSMNGITVSGGRLNAFFAIAEPDYVPPDPILDLATSSPTSNTMGLNWSATGDDGSAGTASYYEVRYSTSTFDETGWAMATRAFNEPTPGAAGAPEAMEVGGLAADTTYYFAVKAFDEWGNPGAISNLAEGTTLPPPTGQVTPTVINEALLTGQTAADVATLSNIGQGTLDFMIPTPAVGGALAMPEPPLLLGKNDTDPRSLPPMTESTGGPDAFGYRWSDSDEPGGPAFSWIDISATGTPIAGLDGDDENGGPIPLGFDFPFYGQLFDSVRVSTNGWLSFTSTATSFSNQTLPSSGAPANLVAPFWDDLHFRNVERATFQTFGSTAVVQWTNVDRFSTGSDLTFQVILEAGGAITFQYLSLSGVTNSATVGIQNAGGTDGLQVAFNQTYLHDNLAIRIAAIPQWLTVTPTSGRLYDGESVPLNVTIDASGLEGGLYPGQINILTNDPTHPVLTIDVTLDVTGAPDAEVQPATLDYGDSFLGEPYDLVFHVLNNGTDVLHVSGIDKSHPDLTVAPSSFDLVPHAAQEVTVTWTPSMLGAFSGSVTVNSDDSGEPSIVVPITGNSIPIPIMVVTPLSYSETLYSGNSVTRNLRVRNTGGSDLVLTTGADLGTGPTGIVPGKDPGAQGSGGPDMFGYRWRDSDEPGGPIYDWVEISGVGTEVQWDSDNYCGFCNVGPFPLGFNFSFYGNTFSEVRASVTGFLSFTSSSTSSSNVALPNSGSSYPENALAVFWDSLYSRNGTGAEPVPSHAYYYNDGTRFIFQYDTFYRAGDTDANLTFQVILYPSGRIVYQYKTMANALINSATIGIQNATKDDGLTVVYNANYVHDGMAVELTRTPDWLSVSPSGATIAPGGYADFDVTFDATDRNGGTLTGNVLLNTNIPTQPTEAIPATLVVIGAPMAAVVPDSWDYGTVYSGYPHLTNFLVINNGTDTMIVSDVISTDPELFVEDSPGGNSIPEAVFTLTPGQSRLFNLRWSPSSPGTLDAGVEIHSDDPVTPVLFMPVTGVAIPPPVTAWSPSSFNEALYVGDVVHRTLHLENNGGSNLDYSSAFRLLGGTQVTVYNELIPQEDVGEDVEGAPDPRPGILGTGGPDMFGYKWKDSDEPGGPVFDWVDISGIGTWVQWDSDNYCGSCNVGPFPLGFEFPFYGNTFDQVRASVTGFLSFTSSSTTSSNQPLPNSGSSVPENLLAVFWDTLYSRNGTGSEPLPSGAWYYSDGTRFIFQFDTFYRSGDFDADLDFEVILYPSGKIVYQYKTMANTALDSATIGIQNATKDDGLTVLYNADYVHDGLAVEIRHPFDFLDVNPRFGTIPPGGYVDLDLTFDTSDLIGGDYLASLDLSTNDPANALIGVPISLDVTGVPDIDADPAGLAFPTTFVGFMADLPLVVKNVGTDVLTISGYSTSGEFIVSGLTTPVSLAVGEEVPVTVTFVPTFDGAHSGSLDIISDDPDEAFFSVGFSGNALIPPEIGLAPAAISTALPPGGTRTKTLTVYNNGGSDLYWSEGTSIISALQTPPQVTVYEELLLGRDETDPRPGILGTGGPDMFGYRWTDSDEPGGPVFDWFDIRGVGTLIDFDDPDGYCIDCTDGPFPLGFNFPFYGNHFNEVHVTTEGWISFTSTLKSYSNQPLPNSGSSVPENLIASFWDDLVLRNGTGSEPVPSHAYYYNDGTRFIVQWTNFYVIADYDTDFTFQVILYPSGKIVHQYLTMANGRLNSATIGQQNATKDDGLTVIHNMDYMHDGLAIQVASHPEWVIVSPASGTIPAGGSQDLELLLNAAGLDDGIHEATLGFSSNDPYTPLASVSVTLNVSLVEPAYMDFEPDVLNLGASGNTVKVTVELPPGLDPHAVDPCSVLLNDTVPVVGCPGAPPAGAVEYSDDWPVGGNGIEEISFRFNRDAANAAMGQGEYVTIWLQGEVTDLQWWRGSTEVRTIRPVMASPAGGEYFVAGWTVPVRWTAPNWGGAMTYTVELSRDGGMTWEVLASGLTTEAFDWVADASVTSDARIRVLAFDETGALLGYDQNGRGFILAGAALMPPWPVDPGAIYVDIDAAGTHLIWKMPLADLGHGPASAFRIMTKTARGGTFTQLALVADTEYTDASGDPPPGGVIFYKIIATNAAGDAE